METILIVGTVANIENTIERDLEKIYKSLSKFKKISFFLVESDSNDNSLACLDKMQEIYSNFEYVSLGQLRSKIPNRLDRIRFCRNAYVDFIRKIDVLDRPNLVAVADLDGMNSALTQKGITSCFARDDWAAVIANQTFGYYDILALRHNDWQKNDWTSDSKLYQENLVSLDFTPDNYLKKIKNFFARNIIEYLVLYSKMIRIPKTTSWIQVDSGFGGFGIYKTSVFLSYNYDKEFDTNETDHVSLSRKITRGGGKIFINPRLINSHFNTYNINKFFIVRVSRKYLWSHNWIYKSAFYILLKKLFKYKLRTFF